jgi:DNA polymerase-3 subunit delta'
MAFRAIVGHRRVVSLLSRAAARAALPPSLLLAGPAGVGKRQTAIALAEAINCQDPTSDSFLERDACGTCASCRRIARRVHPDVVLIEPGETGSIRIEQVRDVIDRAGYRPFEGRMRVVIIDEADALVAPAQNALLKTLEEPPSASMFVLVSSMPDALLPTVQSRCPRLRFGALSAHEVAQVLIRDHGYAEAEAHSAAADAEGSVAAALAAEAADLADAREAARQLLERAARTPDPSRRVDLAKLLAPARRTPGAAERDRLAVHLRALASLLRDLGILATGVDARLVANADLAPQLKALTKSYDADRSVRGYTVVDEALAALERNASPKIVADWLVLRL